MSDTAADMFDRDYAVPELAPGDEIGAYKVARLSSSRITLETNYAMLLFLLAAGVAMAVLDVMVLSERVLSHVLLAWNSMTALAVKGAMVALPLIGIPFVLYSLGRCLHLDADKGTIVRRWLFAFGSTTSLDALSRIELVFETPVTDKSDVNTRLVLLDAKGQTLLEFPGVGAERDNIASNDKTEFARLLALARRVAEVTRAPLAARGDVAALSPVNRRMLQQIVGA
jgi:hypothetical protein